MYFRETRVIVCYQVDGPNFISKETERITRRHQLHPLIDNECQIWLSSCVGGFKCRPTLHRCVVIFFWSSGIRNCMLIWFTKSFAYTLNGVQCVISLSVIDGQPWIHEAAFSACKLSFLNTFFLRIIMAKSYSCAFYLIVCFVLIAYIKTVDIQSKLTFCLMC